VHTAQSGLITVTGGKLTTYRRMSEATVDKAIRMLDRNGHRCLTKQVPLVGAEQLDHTRADPHLAPRFGSEAGTVLALARQAGLSQPLIPGLPYLRAEVVFAARHEMAQTVDVVLSRRTRARILARRASVAAATDVAMLLGAELGLSPDAQQAQVTAYRTRVGEAE
jgi:glycerol-3-phosphate dehydrogenase